MAQNYWTAESGSQQERLGHPGKYHSSLTVAAGETLELTGSNFGYSAVLIGLGANATATKITTFGGSTIDGDDLLVGHIYDISVSKVVANSGPVFVFRTSK